MKTKIQITLTVLVRAREDFQSMRKRMDNRIGRTADGKAQELIESRQFDIKDAENFRLLADSARAQEKETEKMLLKTLRMIPAYNLYLKTVKGIGPVSAGHILSSFNITEATTVSKMWQYAGMNPGMVRGKKRIAKSKYKPEMGTVVTEMPGKDGKGTDVIVLTSDLVRGDRPTEGYVLPYNKNLRTHLLGVMADNFIKAQNEYCMEYYYPYKHRKENDERIIENRGKARSDDGKPWKDVSKGHRDNAAKRYMVKNFLKDLYANWRQIEGLPVRVPYAEEYLGKKHAS
jgi:hypothetical protein